MLNVKDILVKLGLRKASVDELGGLGSKVIFQFDNSESDKELKRLVHTAADELAESSVYTIGVYEEKLPPVGAGGGPPELPLFQSLGFSAVVLIISAEIASGFLSEIGADAYREFKTALKKIFRKLKNKRFGERFSVVVRSEDHEQEIWFLFPRYFNEKYFEEALASIPETLSSLDLSKGGYGTRIYLFDTRTGKWVLEG